MADCSKLVSKMCGDRALTLPAGGCTELRFEGLDDVSVNQGISIDLADGVHAYDGNGNEIPFTFYPTSIDKCDVGEHLVTYTAIGEASVRRIYVRGSNAMHIDSDCDLDTIEGSRTVTVEQIDPPTISGADAVAISANTTFDPMDGVSAVDGNGNSVEVEYSGEYVKTASGEIASFETEVDRPAKSLKVTLEPIQDLNGYDHPWAGGAGKNLSPLGSIDPATGSNPRVFQNTSNPLAEGNYVVSFDMVNATYQNVTSALLDLYDAEGSNFAYPTPRQIRRVSDNATMSSLTQPISGRFYYKVSNHSIRTISALFRSDSYGQWTGRMENVQLEAGTSVTAYEPYSNICPISGRTEVVTQRTGVNVWDEETESGLINSDGTIVADSRRIVSKNYIAIVPSTSYYVQGFINGRAAYYDADKNFVAYEGSFAVSHNFTTPANAHYMKFSPPASYGTVYNHDISINYPSTDTDYHAYDGDTYTTDLGQTVYGGTLDAVSGELVVDRAMVDLGTLTWANNTSGTLAFEAYSTTSLVKPYTANLLSNVLVQKSPYVNVAEYTIRMGSDFLAVKVPTSVANSGAKVKQWLIDNNAVLCYELATPQTYQLTPQEVRLLLGQNNVWSDAGTVEVEFWDNIPQGESYTYGVEGAYSLTYTAEDECGNKSEVTRTITVAQLRTVLYTDGTLIINEPSYSKAENIRQHGAETNVYDPLDADHDYVFEWRGASWYGQGASILSVEIGSPIKPTSITYWFMDLTNCTSIDLTNIDSSNLRSGSYAFYSCHSLENLDVTPLKNAHWHGFLDAMFEDCFKLTALDFTGWDTSNVTNMSQMFSGCYALADLNVTSFDTSNVTTMRYMFLLCKCEQLDLSSFDTSRVRNTEYMFHYAKAKTILASDKFVTDAVTSSANMFGSTQYLVGGEGTAWNSSNPTDKTYAHIDGGTDNPGYFTRKA